jgi:hypothetical protein
MPPKRIKPEQRLDFRLTPRERDLIIERTFIDAEMEERLRAAPSFGSRLIVQLTLDDVDDLAGHVAAEANHCAEPRVRQALEAVYDRLAYIEARFTDEEAEPVAPGQRVETVHRQARAVPSVHLLLQQDSRYSAQSQTFNGFFG